jgi:site-specific DNA-methyltransferase (adenine-specific)
MVQQMKSTNSSCGHSGRWGARPAEQKKGADRGIDGQLYFHDDHSGKSKQIIFSVKAGGDTVSQVRDFRGVLEREKAEIGVFISFEKPTRPMLREAAEAGLYRSGPLDKTAHPRIQILTIEEILAGKQPAYPKYSVDVTFKKPPRSAPASEGELRRPVDQVRKPVASVRSGSLRIKAAT